MESPEGSSKDLATFSATEKVCTVKIFLTIMARNFKQNEEMSDDKIIKEENNRNLPEKMKIGKIFSKLALISDMFIIPKEKWKIKETQGKY